MKTLFSTLVAIAAFSFLAFTAPIDILTVDATASQLTWKGYKVTGSHEGTISVKEGQLLMEDGQLTGGSFVIDINSMTCTDLQGGMADKLLGHLKCDDFFGAEAHPEAKFV
ncbi:MAG: YceI family protein, partial [Bacteroidota bacterium]